MGFDRSRFNQSDLKERHLCPICFDVLEDPVQRVKCQHYFCRECITEWLKIRETCPVDRQPLPPKKLKDAPRLMKDTLADLVICCDFASVGCQAMIKLENLENHVKKCSVELETIMKCEANCGASFKKKNEGSHCCLSHLKEVINLLETNLLASTEIFRREKRQSEDEIKDLREGFDKQLERNEREHWDAFGEQLEENGKMQDEIKGLKEELKRSHQLVKTLRKEAKRHEDVAPSHGRCSAPKRKALKMNGSSIPAIPID